MHLIISGSLQILKNFEIEKENQNTTTIMHPAGIIHFSINAGFRLIIIY
jgi:hypothetical protein